MATLKIFPIYFPDFLFIRFSSEHCVSTPFLMSGKEELDGLDADLSDDVTLISKDGREFKTSRSAASISNFLNITLSGGAHHNGSISTTVF